jgi:hypothetical protein
MPTTSLLHIYLQDRNTPLHEAAFRGDPEILHLVLNKVLEKPSEEAAELINLQNQARTHDRHRVLYQSPHPFLLPWDAVLIVW